MVRAVLAAVVVTSVVACSESVEGSAQAAEFDRAAFVETLDTGDVDVEPRDFESEGVAAGDAGAAFEGQRLGEVVVVPTMIDADLVAVQPGSGVTVGTFGQYLMTPAVGEVAERFGLITSFASFRSDEEETADLGVAVWRFADDDTAVRAATRMHEFYFESDSEQLPSAKTVSSLPDTLAVGDFPGDPEWGVIETVTPVGPHVIYTYGRNETAGESWVLDRTTRIVTEQLELLEDFSYTPTDDLASLPIDVDKVLARAVGHVDDDRLESSGLSVFGAQGALHSMLYPARMAEVMEETGTDRVAFADTMVYRAGDEEGAGVLAEELVEMVTEKYPDFVSISAPQSVPDTTCVGGDHAHGRAVSCVMVFDRYVAEIFGSIGVDGPVAELPDDVSQRVAAQYVKFVRAEETGLGEK